VENYVENYTPQIPPVESIGDLAYLQPLLRNWPRKLPNSVK